MIGRTLPLALLVALTACGDEPAPPPPPVNDAKPAPPPPQIHEGTGLIMAEDWNLVAVHCTGCHSTKQFLRQRGTAQTWQGIIDWMQATQGLWAFPEGIEERIVAYLAENYGPEGNWRRAPIPPTLMPPNPYASGIRAQVEGMRAKGTLPTGPERR